MFVVGFDIDDWFFVIEDFAASWLGEVIDALERCGFACAVSSDETDDFAWLDLERDVFEVELLVVLKEVSYFECFHFFSPLSMIS